MGAWHMLGRNKAVDIKQNMPHENAKKEKKPITS